MAIDITTTGTGPNENDSGFDEDQFMQMFSNLMDQAAHEHEQVKKFLDPRSSEKAKLEILEGLKNPTDTSLGRLAIHGLCNSTPTIREKVIAIFNATEDLSNIELKKTLATMAHHDEPAVKEAIKKIIENNEDSLRDIYILGEEHQLNLFTDPRTVDSERARIALKLKNATMPTLQKLAVYGEHSESKKIRETVAKVIKLSPEAITPTPLEELSYVEQFIDPRASEVEREQIARSVEGEVGPETTRIHLHAICNGTYKIFYHTKETFRHMDYIRSDEMREMLIELGLHEKREVRERIKSCLKDSNFMFGAMTRQKELEGAQIDKLKDPRTSIEQKIKIVKRLKDATSSTMKDLALYGLHDPSSKIRDAVVAVVKTSKHSDVKKMLNELTSSEIPEVKEAASKALGKK
jgi:hypothetical protein